MFGLFAIRISKVGDSYNVYKNDTLIAECPNIVVASAIADHLRDGFTVEYVAKAYEKKAVFK